MSSRFTTVETSLNRAEFRWKWLRFLRHSFVLGIILCLVLSLLAAAILLGWLTNPALANTCLALLTALGFLSWVILIINVAASSPERGWLAAALERVDSRLLDRLNTLLFLERHARDARAQAFALRIAKQLQRLLAQKPSPSPFSGRACLAYLIVFLVTSAGTWLLYRVGSPWTRLAAQTAKPATTAPEDKPLDLAPPATNNVEQDLAWGEVRITEPGTDLKVTKVDVVPLQIEAAANQTLDKVVWFSAVNGTAESRHDLAPPSEPRYAVYHPTLFLDELKLSDWDVLAYFAKANTAKQDSYASELFFLEVRPFREDILKLPGGESGNAYQLLNQMTALIQRQQHIIRQTHLHCQQPAQPDSLRAQDRKKLADAETDLSDATQHLYAEMSSQMENRPIGDALDNLAKAQASLRTAGSLLQNDLLQDAQNRERGALSELVAARKIFQKSISDNPKAFEEPTKDEPTPVADTSKRLSQIAEFRNEAKAAQDFVQRALDQQKDIQQQARPGSRANYQSLAAQEGQLQQALADFQQQHPQAFNPVNAEAQQAQQALAQAAESLQKKNSAAPNATRQATEQLRKLSQAMRDQTAGQQLADAYKLKQMLDQQIHTFDQGAQTESPLSDADLRKTAREAGETISQLKKAAEQEPTRQAFSSPLREALSGENKADLDTRLSRMERPTRLSQVPDRPDSRQRAADARDALGKVSKAFEQSQPKSLQMARQNDSLKPGEEDGFSQGMSELEGLIQQLLNHRPVSPQDQARQGRQALYNLQTGMRSFQGNNDSGNQILLHLDQLLKAEQPLEVGDLQKLLDSLRHFSVETSDKLAKKEDKPEISNIDPARLPPAYRGRIQNYFRKLSEE